MIRPRDSALADGAPSADEHLDLEAAYDLAWHLAGDEPGAARLLSAALRALNQRAPTDRGAAAPAELLVRVYLRRRPILCHIDALVGHFLEPGGRETRQRPGHRSDGRRSARGGRPGAGLALVTAPRRLRRAEGTPAPRSLADAPAVDLARLRPVERACLVLRERLGLPVGEVARIAGLGPAQVLTALFAAREQLLACSAVE